VIIVQFDALGLAIIYWSECKRAWLEWLDDVCLDYLEIMLETIMDHWAIGWFVDILEIEMAFDACGAVSTFTATVPEQ